MAQPGRQGIDDNYRHGSYPGDNYPDDNYRDGSYPGGNYPDDKGSAGCHGISGRGLPAAKGLEALGE